MITLYDFWRSSAAYRVRIALHLKGLPFHQTAINIAPAASEQLGAAYLDVNPDGRVPALVTDDGDLITQSPAIVEWIDAIAPTPRFLPEDPVKAAQIRAFAMSIACDIHPLNNLSPQKYLREQLGASEDAILKWYAHWIERGFAPLEAQARKASMGQAFFMTDEPGLAEIYLVPQVSNARRFNVNLTPYPRLVEIDAACSVLPAFKKALPENQPDAPKA
jgi:maleylpyruvate isomerase